MLFLIKKLKNVLKSQKSKNLILTFTIFFFVHTLEFRLKFNKIFQGFVTFKNVWGRYFDEELPKYISV
jgi:hypothetical protein